MKSSRKFVIIFLLLVALFFAGAIMGTYIPKTMIYLIIVSVAVAADILIVYGYTGRQKEYEEEKEDDSEE